MSNESITEELRKCKECGKVLPLSEFYRDKRWKNVYYTACKQCTQAQRKLHKREYRLKKNNMAAQQTIQFMPKAQTTEQQDPAILYAHIKHVTDDEILKEIARRGFHGELQYSKTVKV